MDIQELLEMLTKAKEGEKTKENVNIKEELNDIIAHLEKPQCAILVTNENVGVMGTGVDILASLSSLIESLLERGISKEVLQYSFDIAFEKYEERKNK